MRTHTVAPLAAAALIALAPAAARADEGWSGAAHGGLAFARGQETVTSGAWLDLLHTIVPNASAGFEAGYLKLPTNNYLPIWAASAWARYAATTEKSKDMFSASAAVRIRGVGPARAHMIGTFGYYHQSAPDGGVPEVPLKPEHEWNPGFSLGLGFAGEGLVRPSIQLRWHEMIGPEDVNLDVITFEVGLHFD